MDDSGSVPLVRVAAEERLYDVEAVLGRDVSSVFRSEAKKDDPDMEAAIGGLKFVTETELEKLKAERGERPEDGTLVPDKSLAEILADNKQAKEDAFQDVWRSMKEGKNRPLDEDESDFLDLLKKQDWLKDREKKEMEDRELTAFQLKRAELDDRVLPASEPKAAAEIHAPQRLKRKTVPAVLHVKPVKKQVTKQSEQLESKGTQSEVPTGGGLLGLADYGSDSD